MRSFVALFVLVAACGEPPLLPPARAPADGTCEVAPMAPQRETYEQRLADAARVCDLYPWLEVLKLGPVAAVQPAGYVFQNANWKRPYGLMVREFRLLAYDLRWANPSFIYDLAVNFNYQFDDSWRFSADVLNRAAVGDALSGWHRPHSGLFIPKDQAINFKVSLESAINYSGLVYLVGAGYRLYPKGTISPGQFTVDDYIQRGYLLVPFSYTTRITVNDSTKLFQASVHFDTDFLCTSWRTSIHGLDGDRVVQPGDDGEVAAALEVKIDTDRTVMSAASNRFTVAGPSELNDWKFERPITVGAGTDWQVSAQLPADAGGNHAGEVVSLDVDFVFSGYKLVKPVAP